MYLMAVWTPAEVPHFSQWLCTSVMRATHYKDRLLEPVRQMAPGVEMNRPVHVSGLREEPARIDTYLNTSACIHYIAPEAKECILHTSIYSVSLKHA